MKNILNKSLFLFIVLVIIMLLGLFICYGAYLAIELKKFFLGISIFLIFIGLFLIFIVFLGETGAETIKDLIEWFREKKKNNEQ